MTDAARPDAAPDETGASDPWAPPQGGAPQDARPAGAPWPPPGAGPYPYPYAHPYPYGQAGPYGYRSEERQVVEGTNGLAITSLVTGVTCCLWPAALGFGIAALVQLRRRRQGGLGLAIAGVVLGTLGLIAGTASAFGDLVNFHGYPTVTAPSEPLPPLPSDSGGPAELTQTQQDFVDDTAELEMRDQELTVPETDPAMAAEDLQSTAQALIDTVETLNKRQWPTEVKGQIATLVSSLQADGTVWKAAAVNTTDPVGALQAALRTNDPATALAAARKAFSLDDNDEPVDPGIGTQPEDSAAPAAA
ncbi:hypothetical protein P3T36_000572 [Kitasatospora sp. MAP12-15]|uniref:DUF4190 domain-containing protein n=1 Tax=unclassified Kitasatospora TaxID=2633591 RepID=UPI002475B807|nr:DUF4190 domain-containing protein [Kitasatospora sp. MAP12-44]MDH6114171.1 hypothetical protein [Kitasatospora sp. MAP12-44]